jgi:hypothetical protein
MKRATLPKKAWQDLATDLLGALGVPGGEYLFVVVDY